MDGHGVVVGRPALLADWGLALDDALTGALERAQASGRTAVAAAWDGRVRALLIVSRHDQALERRGDPAPAATSACGRCC